MPKSSHQSSSQSSGHLFVHKDGEAEGESLAPTGSEPKFILKVSFSYRWHCNQYHHQHQCTMFALFVPSLEIWIFNSWPSLSQSIFVINFFCIFETFFCIKLSSQHHHHVHVNDPHDKSSRSVRGDHLQQQDILWKPQECNFPEAAVERPPWTMIMMITVMMM